MADKELKERVEDILSSRGPSAQAVSRGAATRGAEAAAPPGRPPILFSAFIDDHVARASALAAHFMEVARTQGLAAAVEAVEAAFQQEPVAGLVQYALELFLTHDPQARATFKLKPLEVRQPGLVRSSESAAAAPESAARGAAKGKKKPAGGATAPENKVSYWREDPLLNEHHEHWHLVYPLRPTPPPAPGPKPDGGFQLGDRHGELFAYMHEQMLARYDAERLGAGLDPVEAFDERPLTKKGFTAGIPQGYDPGPLAFWTGGPTGPWATFRARPADATISDITIDLGAPPRPGAKISDEVKFGNALFDAGKTGSYSLLTPSAPVAIDDLGATTEATANSADAYGVGNPNNFKLYGQFHNDGHVHFSFFDNEAPSGVMATTATAVRDPIFFRWHKLVDDVFHYYQEKQLAPYDFTTGPAVRLRKSAGRNGAAVSRDIILCRQEGMPDSVEGYKFRTRAYNNLVGRVFGDAAGAWDKSFTAGKFTLPSGETITTTDELHTEMLARNINLQDENGNAVTETVHYLSHEDFYYFIRVENLKAEEQPVAVRVFLAPETEVENRRAWIELDKFVYRLKPSERAVIFRPADQSSVVRKPALKPDDLTAEDGASPAREAQPWCDCGWPYTLLLPRGTKRGMKFRLLVMCSNGDDLTVPDLPECCTSISYCGLKDTQYPDKVAMGYPFDRKFEDSVAAAVESHDNWAWRSIKIRCRNA